MSAQPELLAQLPLRPASPPRSTELPPYALKAGAGKEADQHDAALASILARLAEHRRRRTLLLAFAQSPVDFIHAMAAAQVSSGLLGGLARPGRTDCKCESMSLLCLLKRARAQCLTLCWRSMCLTLTVATALIGSLTTTPCTHCNLCPAGARAALIICARWRGVRADGQRGRVQGPLGGRCGEAGAAGGLYRLASTALVGWGGCAMCVWCEQSLVTGVF